MNELRAILDDTVNRLFTDHVTTALLEGAEKGQRPAALWQAVEESGLTLPQVPGARGGGGGSWEDAHVVVTAAGRCGIPAGARAVSLNATAVTPPAAGNLRFFPGHGTASSTRADRLTGAGA